MDFHNLCRICLKNDLLVSIFISLPSTNSMQNTYLVRPIEIIEKLNIFKIDDGLSKFLCQSCLYHLMHLSQEVTQLQQLAQATEQQLLEYLRCNFNFKQDVNLLTPPDFIEQHEVHAHFTDIFRATAVNEEPTIGNDEMLEIDVSSLTRSEAGDTLSEVFVDAQGNCFGDDIVDVHSSTNVYENSLTAANETATDLVVQPKGVKTKVKALKETEKCLDCGKCFKTFGYLAKHQRKHTGEKPFKCKFCERQFSYQSNLRLHQQMHSHQRRKFQCELCAKFLTTASNLKAHRLTHKEVRDFRCEKCSKSFKSARELRRHEPIHNSNKIHHCEQCEKKFHKSCYLNAHILSVHKNQRKFQCTNCTKTFTKNSNLQSHMRIHSGEKPFQCKLCVWKFSQSSALMRHMQKKHPYALTSQIELQRPATPKQMKAYNIETDAAQAYAF